MPIYIDADLLLEEVENNTHLNFSDSERELAEQFDFKVFKHIIEYQPTADVVPKSEVEKAIDDLKRYIILNEDISKKCKTENGEQNEEYWMGKLSAFLQILGYIDAELKKKYTEGEPNG